MAQSMVHSSLDTSRVQDSKASYKWDKMPVHSALEGLDANVMYVTNYFIWLDCSRLELQHGMNVLPEETVLELGIVRAWQGMETLERGMLYERHIAVVASKAFRSGGHKLVCILYRTVAAGHLAPLVEGCNVQLGSCFHFTCTYDTQGLPLD